MKKRRCLIVCLLLAVLMLLAGCANADEWELAEKSARWLGDNIDDESLRKDVEAMLDAIIADDSVAAYSLISETVSEEDFQAFYAQIRQILADVENYELVASNIEKHSVLGGETTVTIRYMMTAGEQRFFIDAAQSSDVTGLVGFYVNAYETPTQTGSLTTMKNANAAQWVLLIIGMLEIVFIIAMFVDCCCHKMKNKWLWLIIIALGMFTVGASLNGGNFRFNVNLGLYFSYTALILYSNGNFVLRILLPVGALVYLILRRKLHAVPNRPQMPEETVQNEEIQQITEETSDIEEPCEEESL